MQVNAVNSTNFKGLRNYDRELQEHQRILQEVNDFEDKYINASDIKPLPLWLSSGIFATAKSAIEGSATALFIDKTFKNKPSNALDSGAKKAVDFIGKQSAKLIKDKPKNILAKAENALGKGIKTLTESASTALKNSSATKKAGIVGALASILMFVPKALTVDNNKDGIADIAQFSQAYNDNSAKLDKIQESAGVLAKVAQALL